jgi:signal transduction histidine kinase
VLLAGELRGVLLHFSRQPLFDDIVEVLATFSTMVATSLNHAQLFAREQAARAEAEQAQRELAALAESNVRLLRQVQEASRQREELISTATHDLKNPLVSIKGLAQVLYRHVSQDQAPSVERLLRGLSGIDEAAGRMAGLIDEMLDIAHLQAGAPLALERTPVDLVALARQLVAQYQQSTERHQLRVETALDALMCALDAARMERVLGNLLSNAIKFSPQGGEIVVTVARQGDEWAMLEVRDQGLGIPAADLPHIFERGHRGGNVAGQVSGWGIGLAGARQIVEQHGGAIAARSQPGAGATFTIRLPLAAEAQ